MTRRYAWVCGVVYAVIALGCAGRPPDPSLWVPKGWPVLHDDRCISSGYGYRTDPITGRRRFHGGIDIAAPKKVDVVATANGKVLATGRDRGGYGKFVVIDHGNGYTTRYAHLAWIKTKRGKRVERGDVIGKLGKTGRTTGFHLHYEVHLNGRTEDPRGYLSR